MSQIPYLRRLIFGGALTVATLAGAASLLTQRSAVAQEPIRTTCSNTECHGVTYCRQWSRMDCALSRPDGVATCRNTNC